MTTKTIYAAIAGAVVAFLLGWLVFGIMLDSFYTAHTIKYVGLMKNPPVWWAIFAFDLGFSLLFAIIFSKWANIASFGQGFIAGSWMGFLIILSFDLMFYAFMHLMLHTALIVDVIVNAIFW